MKKIFVLCLIVFTLVISVGCNTASNSNTIEIVDMVGDTVVVPKNPENVAVI